MIRLQRWGLALLQSETVIALFIFATAIGTMAWTTATVKSINCQLERISTDINIVTCAALKMSENTKKALELLDARELKEAPNRMSSSGR